MGWKDPTKYLIFDRILYFQKMCFSPVCFLPGHRKDTISVCSCLPSCLVNLFMARVCVTQSYAFYVRFIASFNAAMSQSVCEKKVALKWGFFNEN